MLCTCMIMYVPCWFVSVDQQKLQSASAVQNFFVPHLSHFAMPCSSLRSGHAMVGACHHLFHNFKSFKIHSSWWSAHRIALPPAARSLRKHKSSATNYGFVARLSFELHSHAVSGLLLLAFTSVSSSVTFFYQWLVWPRWWSCLRTWRGCHSGRWWSGGLVVLPGWVLLTAPLLVPGIQRWTRFQCRCLRGTHPSTAFQSLGVCSS